MSTHVDRIKASEGRKFLAQIESHVTEDWQAGGAFADVLEDLKREGHISADMYVAGARLMIDMTRCHGRSSGLVSGYDDNPRKGRPDLLPSDTPEDVDAFSRMNTVLCALRSHERELLSFCVLSRDLPRGGLSEWGRQRSRYATAKTQRAMAVGQIVALLGSIFEIYKLHSYPS